MRKKIISREDSVPYLVRYSIFSCRWFAVKVHNILISDDACLHDHPWAFITFILKGSYTEETQGYILDENAERLIMHTHKQKLYKRFSLLYRPMYHIHRLIVNKPVWTLVITFKKKKRWGFFTPKGWVEHMDYKYDGGCD